MERWCCVEAKTFVFTVVGASAVRLEERRKFFSGLVVLSAQCIGWLASTMENLQWFPGEDFIRSFREGSKVLIVRRGGNAVGRFLEVAVYGAGGRRGIIFIPEGRDGRGWRSFVLELDKFSAFLKVPLRLGVVCPATVREKTRRKGDGDFFSKDGAPSFADVLRSGPSRLEVERTLSQQTVSLAKDRGECPEEQKLPIVLTSGSENLNSQVNPLGKEHCYRCGSDFVKAETVSATQDKTGCFYGDNSAGNQLTGVMNTYSFLLIWKSQLEKLKAEVDQALSRVCEGLLEIGPGLKPNATRQKRKKNLKKKRRLRWVKKDPKPNALVLKDRVVLPVEGLLPAKGSGGSDKSPASPEISGGLGSPSFGTLVSGSQRDVCSASSELGSRLDFDEVLLEEEVGPFEKMGLSSKLPEVAGGPSFALEVLVPIKVSSSSVLSSRPVPPILLPEVSPLDPVDSALVSRGSGDELTIWAGLGRSDSLFPSGLPLSDSTLTHIPSSGSGLRNGMELALMLVEEPEPLSLFDKVRGFSGEKSSRGFLKAVLAYSHSVGITCDGYESQLSAVFESIINNNDKKVAGSSSSMSIKDTGELNRLACSVNYDAHSGSTSRGRCKGRAFGGLL
jgi:hypothetical protein